MIHALTLLGSPAVRRRRSPRYVPLPVLAAILFVVAWNMGEWREIAEICEADLRRHRWSGWRRSR